ncbi:HPP family protein [Rhizobium sp. DKSPLA3]|uniref:HPP family protein n=1 Tax=Rhizobium quercicola TaxID=2901226 RepID=A0A9X1NS04_9HYPH|nr:HPP family protein [Rhizobium quercicola]MCD7109343.1 HPP family protein [Rhizobium quercicola]
MPSTTRSRAARFMPWPASPVSPKERLRSAAGALFGLLVTGLLGALLSVTFPLSPALVAPMGASAVLLFAVPSSPLAQPWSLIGGNLVAAFVGVTVAKLVADPMLAAALAGAAAIGLMMSLRCLHPPSGAIALTAVLGGPAIHALGYGFLLWPVLGNSLLLLAAALLFNNLTGRRYPHLAAPTLGSHQTKDPPPAARIGFAAEDLDAVLKDYDRVLDIQRDELVTILKRTELRSFQRRSGQTPCGQIMSRDVIAIAPDASLSEAHALLRAHHIKALPVTDDHARVIGILTQTDILDRADWTRGRPTIGLRRRYQLAVSGATAPNGTVKDIMTSPVRSVSPESSLSEAILLFAEGGLHHLPVTDPQNRLAGILSQSDVLVAMLAEG